MNIKFVASKIYEISEQTANIDEENQRLKYFLRSSAEIFSQLPKSCLWTLKKSLFHFVILNFLNQLNVVLIQMLKKQLFLIPIFLLSKS